MRDRIFLFIIFNLVISTAVMSQSVIKMEKMNGVFVMPCTVNGLSLNFYFDTGASNVCISLTEAMFMLKNGYLSPKDIIGTEYYTIANGNIEEGTIVILRQISIGNYLLYNVQASVNHNLDAPLLLGQSALSKLGKIQIDYQNNTLTILDDLSKKDEVSKKDAYTKYINESPKDSSDYKETESQPSESIKYPPHDSIISYKGVTFTYPINWNIETQEIELDMAYYISCENNEPLSPEIFSITKINSEIELSYMIKNMSQELKKTLSLKKSNIREPISIKYNGLYALNVDYNMDNKDNKVYGRMICFHNNGRTILLVKQTNSLKKLEYEFKTIENSLKIE